MEYKITDREIRNNKGLLTGAVVYSAIFCVACAVMREFAGYQLHDPSNPLAGLPGLGMLLGMLIAVQALNVRLRLQLEEPEPLD
jgi:hypothetical protein